MADSIPVPGAIDLAPAPATHRLWLETLHDWITTVDHKKIGLMYIGYALVFLVIAGLEAVLIRASTRGSAKQPGFSAGF